MKRIISDANIQNAMQGVIKRKGCAGTDGMNVRELPEFWAEHGEVIKTMLLKGEYIPAPAKRSYISKTGKKEKRKLAIPTVLDRMIQNAILYVLVEEYEKEFHMNSFGFRKGRDTYQALDRCLEFMNQGYMYAADLDIQNFFDSVKHNILLEAIEKKIQETEVLKVIKRYIQMGVLISGNIIRQRYGIIQGGPLSPLLANIVLNNLDWYLENLNIRFVRYADDIVLFGITLEDAENAKVIAKKYIEETLGLLLNEEKTKVLHVNALEYLGYTFAISNDQQYVLSINKKIEEKMIQKLKKHINYLVGDEVKWWERIAAFHRGWINYYKKAELQKLILFLQKAEEEEEICLHNKMNLAAKKNPNLMWKIIECKAYISMTQWLKKSIKEKIM